MQKNSIEKIRIDVISESQSALCLMLGRDGFVSRQGTGNLPIDETVREGRLEPGVFARLVEHLDERVFPHAGVYDHPDKAGVPITFSIAFLDAAGESAGFEFRVGTETPDVGELLPYFDSFVAAALEATDDWFARQDAATTKA